MDPQGAPAARRQPDGDRAAFAPPQVLRPAAYVARSPDDARAPPAVPQQGGRSYAFSSPSTAVGISGVAWYVLQEGPRPPWARNPNDAPQFFTRSPAPVPASWLPTGGAEGDRPHPPPAPDSYELRVFRPVAAANTISGIAWHVTGERYDGGRPRWDDRQARAFTPQAQPGGGIGWTVRADVSQQVRFPDQYATASPSPQRPQVGFGWYRSLDEARQQPAPNRSAAATRPPTVLARFTEWLRAGAQDDRLGSTPMARDELRRFIKQPAPIVVPQGWLRAGSCDDRLRPQAKMPDELPKFVKQPPPLVVPPLSWYRPTQHLFVPRPVQPPIISHIFRFLTQIFTIMLPADPEILDRAVFAASRADSALFVASGSDRVLFAVNDAVITMSNALGTYDIDTNVQIRVTFSNAITGQPIDPTVVNLFLVPPIGAIQNFALGSSAIIRENIGVYSFTFTFAISGTWTYKWQGTGAVVATSPDSKIVINPSLAIAG